MQCDLSLRQRSQGGKMLSPLASFSMRAVIRGRYLAIGPSSMSRFESGALERDVRFGWLTDCRWDQEGEEGRATFS